MFIEIFRRRIIELPGRQNLARHYLEPGRIAGPGPNSTIKFGVLSCPAVRISCAEPCSISPDFSAGQDTSSNYQLFVSVLPGPSGWIVRYAPIRPPFSSSSPRPLTMVITPSPSAGPALQTYLPHT
jgi:hypothetical protein